MTTTFTQAQGTRSSALLTMSTLASGNYIASSAIDLGATIPMDVTFEVEVTVTSPLAPFQVFIFVQLSLDNTNFSSGPTSGTTTTDEPDLYMLGYVPCGTTGTHRKFMNLSASGIPVARYLKLIAKNSAGVTLTSGFIYRADITVVGT